MAKFQDLTGCTFGKWTVFSRAPSNRSGQAKWHCRCACGNEKEVFAANLRNGKSKGCQRCALKTHGHTQNPLYQSWYQMIDRCTNPASRSFIDYGAKGIRVCPRWTHPEDGFPNFFQDVGERPEGCSLDRIHNDEGYYPGNVRWASKATQARNRANVKLTVEAVGQIKARLLAGVTGGVKALAAEFGVSTGIISTIKSGKCWADVPCAATA